MHEETQGHVSSATTDVRDRLAALELELENLNTTYDERLSALTDEIMQEAKSVEQRLENWKGGKAKETVLLGDRIIIDEGEKVGREHLVMVQDFTKDDLTQGQKDNEEERQTRFAELSREVSELKGETSNIWAEMQDSLTVKVTRLRQQHHASKEQLENLAEGMFLNENDYREIKSKFGNAFRANMGAEAFYEILKNMDLDKLAKELWREVRTTRSKQAAKRATKRLQVVEALRQSGNRPEWMILTVLPVIPPELRPMVQLDGGRFATSDLNDLYRRVINRNNRLKRLLELGAPRCDCS